MSRDIDVGKDEAKRIALPQRFENLLRTSLALRHLRLPSARSCVEDEELVLYAAGWARLAD